MRTVRVTCRGVSPLLMDRMTDEVLGGLITGVRPELRKDRPLPEVAADKIYRDTNDGHRIGLPAEMLFASLVKAGQNVKRGKKQISTADSTTLPDFLSITDFFLPLVGIDPANESASWKVDKRRGRLTSGKTVTTIGIVRPRFDAWQFDVNIQYDNAKVDDSTVKTLFTNAGSTQGLGAFRPNCKGPFGRFVVTGWNTVAKDETEEVPAEVIETAEATATV